MSTMVQLKLPEMEKESPSLLPTTHEEGELGLDTESRSQLGLVTKRRPPSLLSNKSCGLLVLLALVFSLVTVKEMCDLKQENMELRQLLAIERQKDAALKLAVRDNIPSSRFLSHTFSPSEVALVAAEGTTDHIQVQPAGWSIKLSVLWTSPTITPCDMARLSHLLAEEIYTHQIVSEFDSAPLLDEKFGINYEDLEEEVKENEMFHYDSSLAEEYEWNNEDEDSDEDSGEDSVEDIGEDSGEDSGEESVEYDWSAELESDEGDQWDLLK